MTSPNVQDGTQIAEDLQSPSDCGVISTHIVKTLAEVLAAVGNDPPPYFNMLRSTAVRLEAFFGKPAHEISLDSIYANHEGFRPFLKKQPYKENSVRAYVNFVRILLNVASQLGWKPFANVPEVWKVILTRASEAGCLELGKFLAQTRSSPADVTQADGERWLQIKIRQGIKYGSAKTRMNEFWRILVAAGYRKNATEAQTNRTKYGVPLSDLPPLLRDEVIELLRWKSVDFEPGRLQSERIRKISANHLQQAFSILYGYAVNIRKSGDVTSLCKLVQESNINDFVAWSMNVRKKQSAPLVAQLGSMLAAVSQHPRYRALNWTWFRPILGSIRCDSSDEVKSRKALKYLDYSEMEKIPAKIRATRGHAAKQNPALVARAVRDELLMKWLVILPWRQRNIRECRIDGPNPNLFKEKIPPFSYIDKPEWALQEETKKPDAEFWQFRFSKDETKTGISIRALVPRPLIPLLEEYIAEARPLLVKGKTPDSLFVTSDGDPMGGRYVTLLVSDLSLRHGGRRVTPHLFRDIVAFAWLKAHREDYLTLSKMLWHKSILTTIDYYGSRFNESSASIAMESWVEEREAKS
jgi:site-specific recombinase XerD